MKKLDKTICKGGMFGKKEVLGIMFASKSNRHYIYESTGPSYLNIFTIEIPPWKAHQLTLHDNDAATWKNENNYVPYIDWGGGELITDSSGNKIFKHYYNNHGSNTPWRATIRTTCEPQFYIGSNPQVDNFPGEYVKDVVSIRTDYLEGGSLFYGFSGVKSIREPVLLRLNTSVFTNMSSMFAYCSSMEVLELSSFNTSNVESMGDMFFKCSSLPQLDLSSFDTSKVWGVSGMFSDCTSLVKLNLSNFNLDSINPNGYGMDNFLAGCDSLQKLRLDNCNYDTINKIINSYGFPTGTINGEKRKLYCKAKNMGDLKEPDGWEFIIVIDESEDPIVPRPVYGVDIETFAFKDDTSLVHTDVMVNKTTYYLSYMFSGCTNLVSVNTKGWDTSGAGDMQSMFYNCQSLPSIDLSKFDTSDVRDMDDMFCNCLKLTTVGDVSGWDVSMVTDMDRIFKNCYKLTTLDLSGWKTVMATQMNEMFYNCVNLEVLDIRNFKAPSIGQTERIFDNCNKLRVIRMDNCDNRTMKRFIDNQENFPKGDIGVDRVIYCKQSSLTDSYGYTITPPSGWRFKYVD